MFALFGKSKSLKREASLRSVSLTTMTDKTAFQMFVSFMRVLSPKIVDPSIVEIT